MANLTARTPRYKWSSPQDWLGDRINELLATAHAESLTDSQYRAIAESGIVHYFCSEKCRRTFETDVAVQAGQLVGGSPEVDDGTVCDECGNELAAPGSE